MSSNSNSPKPKVACEIAADRVLVGRLAADGQTLEASAAHELAPGSVVPDLVENNLRQRDPVVSAVKEIMSGVAGRTHDVIAVVPDAAVRVVLLEFDTLPSDAEEASGVVRFRMKKSLPFDVDKARVSYHSQKTSEGVRVVAAVALANKGGPVTLDQLKPVEQYAAGDYLLDLVRGKSDPAGHRNPHGVRSSVNLLRSGA